MTRRPEWILQTRNRIRLIKERTETDVFSYEEVTDCARHDEMIHDVKFKTKTAKLRSGLLRLVAINNERERERTPENAHRRIHVFGDECVHQWDWKISRRIIVLLVVTMGRWSDSLSG